MKKEKRLTEWVGENASLILDSPRTEEEARRQVVERFKKACNKLATLEDLIERGELVEAEIVDEEVREAEEILFVEVYNELHEKEDYRGCSIVAEMARERGISLLEEQE